MGINKFIINKYETNFRKKPIYFFVNHKVSVICWAKIKKSFNLELDVLTFDSHRDYHASPPSSKEYLDWDLTNDFQNRKLIVPNGYLVENNDNFIDLAFYKNVIRNVYAYFLDLPENLDLNNQDPVISFNSHKHKYTFDLYSNFKLPTNKFIFDLDLDFLCYRYSLLTWKIRDNYKLILMQLNEIIKNDNCLGVTIALEPNYCGGAKECKKLINEISKMLNNRNISSECNKLLHEFYSLSEN